MLLPQTDAFILLKNRLQCVPNYWGIAMEETKDASIESQSKVDFKELLEHFQQIQNNHQKYRINQRARKLALWDNNTPK